MAAEGHSLAWNEITTAGPAEADPGFVLAHWLRAHLHAGPGRAQLQGLPASPGLRPAPGAVVRATADRRCRIKAAPRCLSRASRSSA